MDLFKRRKKILKGSIWGSICLHVLAIFFFSRQSLWFASKKLDEKTATSWIATIEKVEKDQILKDAFRQGSLSKAEEKSPTPQPELLAQEPLRQSLALPIQHLRSTPLPPQISSFTENSLTGSQLQIHFSFPKHLEMDLFKHLPKDLLVPPPQRPVQTPGARLSPPPPLALEKTLNPTYSPKLPQVPNTSLSNDRPSVPMQWKESLTRTQVASFLTTPTLPKIPSLSELQTISYSNQFDIEIVFTPDETEGYIFALTLIPKKDLKLSILRQHYFFLIDRSNSIQKDRLVATKNAVHKALEQLDGEDTFNIFVFDNKITKLSPTSLHPSPTTYAQADTFLNGLELGSFFSQGDPYKPLFLTIPIDVPDDECHTAILLTDGEHFGKKSGAQMILRDWTEVNGGKVALYAVGMTTDNHLATLDAATAFNRGKLFTAPTKRGLKRKLLKLVKTIQSPVAKNISCHSISLSPNNSITIFPKPTQTPHLYLDEPYVVLGKAKTLDDFVLFVQGKLHKEWFQIKKSISFLNAKQASHSLKSEWALQQSYHLYKEYLRDDNPEHLTQVQKLLEPHDLQSALR